MPALVAAVLAILLIGFVISLSSTAVVLRILEDQGELGTQVGSDVLGILLVQDVALVPMLVIIGIFGGERSGAGALTLQITVFRSGRHEAASQ